MFCNGSPNGRGKALLPIGSVQKKPLFSTTMLRSIHSWRLLISDVCKCIHPVK